ncbi:LysR family transcriptional regulator [Cognatishimia sp. SS12]|uniref:LysR family transcriptional regulator n=1 Tax=Cognatishimia sp. SS12 TaxID=2979465 RepID=UPI00232D3CFD|nr:LysR family transcriptional regulator [Cognatishimia sp. SS12]MDC0738993.1 LysR family transcriptional regulator [Cognatishimia sp. SS12]
MDLRFVESFLLVAKEKSIAATARRQSVTAAAVSQRLAALEAELGVKLVTREGRHTAITSEGQALIPSMQGMLDIQRDMARLLAADTLTGVLRFGAISTALGQYGSKLVSHLNSQAPEVTLQVSPGTSEELYDAVRERRLDAAIIVKPPFALPKALRFDRLAAQKIGIFRQRNHAASAPYVVYDRNSWGGAQCWKALLESDSDPNVICEMDAPEVIAQIVIQGLGQAVLPDWEGLPDTAGTTFVPLGHERTIGLIYWQRDARSPLTKQLKRALGVA